MVVMLKSLVFHALPLPEWPTLTAKLPVTPFNVAAKVIVSPSSTWRPGQVVSRSPLRLPVVPQLAGVPPQLPLAARVTVCAAAGVDASATKARTKAALPPEVR